MYRDKVGHVVYETLDELLVEDIVFVSEYEGFYYVKLKPRERFENCIWKVDKKTGKAVYMMFTEYILEVEDIVTPINPATLKRRA